MSRVITHSSSKFRLWRRSLALCAVLMAGPLAGCTWFDKDQDKPANQPPSEPPPKTLEMKHIQAPPIIKMGDWALSLPSGSYRMHRPEQIAIASEPSYQQGQNTTLFLRQLHVHHGTNTMLPYHYYIDTIGVIYEGRDLSYVATTGEKRLPDGVVMIGMLGGFEPDSSVAFFDESQLDGLAALCAWLCGEYRIPLDRIVSANQIDPTISVGLRLSHLWGANQILQSKVTQQIDTSSRTWAPAKLLPF